MPMIKAMICVLYKNCLLFIICLQIHTHIHANKLVDNTCCSLEKQIQHVLSCQEYLISYPKVNHHLI